MNANKGALENLDLISLSISCSSRLRRKVSKYNNSYNKQQIILKPRSK